MEYGEIKRSTVLHNRTVRSWGRNVEGKLRFSIMSMSSKGRGRLARSLKTKFKSSYGEVERVSYSFLRHGIFFQKGVGKGYILEGNVLRRGSRDGNRIVTSASQLRGHILRSPKDWSNRILDSEVQVLADQLVQIKSDAVVDTIKIKN